VLENRKSIIAARCSDACAPRSRTRMVLLVVIGEASAEACGVIKSYGMVDQAAHSTSNFQSVVVTLVARDIQVTPDINIATQSFESSDCPSECRWYFGGDCK
jgi:hypothetical protein